MSLSNARGVCVIAPTPFLDDGRIDNDSVQALKQISTATLTTVLLKKGLRNVWTRGTCPLPTATRRVAGRAFTLRFVPAREDLATPNERKDSSK